jgi:hypothetical protein
MLRTLYSFTFPSSLKSRTLAAPRRKLGIMLHFQVIRLCTQLLIKNDCTALARQGLHTGQPTFDLSVTLETLEEKWEKGSYMG